MNLIRHEIFSKFSRFTAEDILVEIASGLIFSGYIGGGGGGGGGTLKCDRDMVYFLHSLK